MARGPLPSEGSGWRSPFIGPWGAAATSLQSFNVIACVPDPIMFAVGTWWGVLHAMAAITKPVPWAPSLGGGQPGTPHGGRKGGRNRKPKTPVAKFRPVWNIPATSEFQLDNGLKLALFDIGSLALEIGFILFLADVFRDSLLIGTSAAYRFKGCIPSTYGPAQASITPTTVANGPPVPVSWHRDYDPDHLIGFNEWLVPPGVSLSFTYTIEAKPASIRPLPRGGISLWLFDESAGVKIGGAGTGWAPGQTGPFKLGNQGVIPVSSDARFYQLWMEVTGGWLDITGGSLTIGDALSLRASLFPDP